MASIPYAVENGVSFVAFLHRGAACPEDRVDLVGPHLFSGFEALFEFCHDGFSCSLCLTVSLRITRCRIGQAYFLLFAECSEGSRYELGSVVCNNFVRESRSVDNVDPDEVCDIDCFNFWVGFCFYPFG